MVPVWHRRERFKPPSAQETPLPLRQSVLRRSSVVAVVALASTALVPLAAQAAFIDGSVRISIGSGGADANGGSYGPSISDDGGVIAFTSDADNLVGSDGNGVADVFASVAGSIRLVSVTPSGQSTSSGGYGGVVSANGTVVAFSSSSDDLGGEVDGLSDIFVRDLAAGVTSHVSVSPPGGPEFQDAFGPALSGDGDVVAFTGVLTPVGGGKSKQLFVHRRSTNATIVVSRSADGALGDGSSYAPTLSADGCVVAFVTDAPNLDSAGAGVYARNICDPGEQLEPLTPSDGGIFDGRPRLGQPSISADGRYIAVQSEVGGSRPAVAIYDRNNLFSPSIVPMQAGETDGRPDMSAGGTTVVFQRSFDDGRSGIASYDLSSATTTWVSDPATSSAPAVTGDGQTVVFESAEPLSATDANGVSDIYRRSQAAAAQTAQLDGTQTQTVQTNTAVTNADPIGAAVTVPAGLPTNVSITELSAAAGDPLLTGFRVLDFSVQIEVTQTNPDGTTTPYASMANPLTLAFYLDASLLGGAQPEDLVIQRNGVVLQTCSAAGNVPPCVVSSGWTSGLNTAVKLEVLTDHASAWTVAVVEPDTVTTDQLCSYTKNASSSPGVATSLCTKLRNGSARAFLNQLAAQTGKAIPAKEASVLRALVR